MGKLRNSRFVPEVKYIDTKGIFISNCIIASPNGHFIDKNLNLQFLESRKRLRNKQNAKVFSLKYFGVDYFSLSVHDESTTVRLTNRH